MCKFSIKNPLTKGNISGIMKGWRAATHRAPQHYSIDFLSCQVAIFTNLPLDFCSLFPHDKSSKQCYRKKNYPKHICCQALIVHQITIKGDADIVHYMRHRQINNRNYQTYVKYSHIIHLSFVYGRELTCSPPFPSYKAYHLTLLLHHLTP